MALELEGRITRKLPVQQGTSARGAWAKQEFIFEYQEGKFPTSICMNVWGVDKVKISFNLSSREYNGRWYTDVSAWRIEPAGAQPQTYNQAPVQNAPMPVEEDLPGGFDDGDMPF